MMKSILQSFERVLCAVDFLRWEHDFVLVFGGRETVRYGTGVWQRNDGTGGIQSCWVRVVAMSIFFLVLEVREYLENESLGISSGFFAFSTVCVGKGDLVRWEPEVCNGAREWQV
jgi:hypothetical protein